MENLYAVSINRGVVGSTVSRKQLNALNIETIAISSMYETQCENSTCRFFSQLSHFLTFLLSRNVLREIYVHAQLLHKRDFFGFSYRNISFFLL